MSVIAGEAANISGSAPATSATARRFRSPTICVANRLSMRQAFPITPTTGLLLIFRYPTPNRKAPAEIMPAGRRRINMLGGKAAMLFPGESLLGIGPIAERQARRPQRNSRGAFCAAQPGQFRLDPATHGLAERPAEIERPPSV